MVRLRGFAATARQTLRNGHSRPLGDLAELRLGLPSRSSPEASEGWLGGRESLLQLSEIPAKTGLPIGCVEERIGLQSECVKRDIRNLMFKLPGQRASADAPRVFTMSSDRYRASAARRGR